MFIINTLVELDKCVLHSNDIWKKMISVQTNILEQFRLGLEKSTSTSYAHYQL